MKRFVELLIYPLIVGIVVAIIAFGMPLLTKKDKILEYKIENPVAYISPNRIGDLEVKINGIETKHLNSYSIILENVGDLPIKKIPIRYQFQNPESGFNILTDFHRTDPPYEFGEIKLLNKDSVSLRYEYQLLNPDDKVEITILTTKIANLDIFSKQEDLSFVQAKEDKSTFPNIEVIVVVTTMIVSLLTTLLNKIPRLNKIVQELVEQVVRTLT